MTKYVEDAAKVVEKSGPSCGTLESKQWRGGDYYIFVLGPDGNTICHPRSEMIGKPAASIVNAKGDKVGEMIAAKGSGSGKGWVDYAWPRPGQTAEEPKSTCFFVGLAFLAGFSERWAQDTIVSSAPKVPPARPAESGFDTDVP